MSTYPWPVYRRTAATETEDAPADAPVTTPEVRHAIGWWRMLWMRVGLACGIVGWTCIALVAVGAPTWAAIYGLVH